MTEITDYQSLLVVGREQTEAQHFLFVFLQSSLPDDASEADKQRFQEGLGGELQAIMCVDKPLAELTNFADLVEESAQMEQAWSLVLIACLSGRNGSVPNAEEADEALKIMVQTVQSGSELSRYLAFDRQGELLSFA